MKIDAQTLRQFAAVALPLVQQFGGKDPRIAQVGEIASALLGENKTPETAPLKQDMDAALKNLVADRRKATQEAREALKFKPPSP